MHVEMWRVSESESECMDNGVSVGVWYGGGCVLSVGGCREKKRRRMCCGCVAVWLCDLGN